MANRITTREAAKVLDCTLAAALVTLKTARVSNVRCGSGYLWDLSEVEKLKQALHLDTSEDNHRNSAGAR